MTVLESFEQYCQRVFKKQSVEEIKENEELEERFGQLFTQDETIDPDENLDNIVTELLNDYPVE